MKKRLALRKRPPRQPSERSGSEPANKELEEYLESLRPESKAYLSDGVVEVLIRLDVVAFLEKAEHINPDILKGAHKVDDALLDRARRSAKDRTITGVGHARIDGWSVSAPQLARGPVAIDLNEVGPIALD